MDDRAVGGVRILLGRRGERHVFMPCKFVFPGGRVDPADVKLARSAAVDIPALDRLLAHTNRRFLREHAIALLLAGIRETFEEAGIMIGRRSARPELEAGGSAWSAFAAAGVVPDLDALVPVARAITPPGHVRRYDTRFFCVGAESIAHRTPFEQRIDRELDQLGWFTLDEVEALDLPDITRQVLGDMMDRLRDGRWRKAGQLIPVYRVRHRQRVRDWI